MHRKYFMQYDQNLRNPNSVSKQEPKNGKQGTPINELSEGNDFAVFLEFHIARILWARGTCSQNLRRGLVSSYSVKGN